MIDLTNLRAPGWARVVAELSAGAADDAAFLERILRVLGQVSAARQAALFRADRGEGAEADARLVAVWPAPAGAGGEGSDVARGSVAEGGLEQAAEHRRAALAALESVQARAFGLDRQDQLYDATPGAGYVLAVPLPGGPDGRAAGVVTMAVEPRSRTAVQSTLAMAEVIAGYVHGHAARQQLRRTQAAGAALDLATRLIAALNQAPSFKGASLQLVNDLAKQLGVDRAALGWAHGDAVKVQAISDTEHFDRRMAMVQKLEAAMDECLDQQQPVLYPPPAVNQDVLLAQAVVHAHRELAAQDANLKACSMPLRIDDRIVGVVTLESTGTGRVDAGTVELIQAAMDLVAPVLSVRRSDDRWLPQRAWDSTLRAGAWAVGSKHTAWKLAGLVALAALLTVTFVHAEYRVGADGTLQPRTRRVISAPFDGVIGVLPPTTEPGRAAAEGDLLLELDTTELRLSAQDARARLLQAQIQKQQAMKEGKAGDAARAQAQADRADAELRLAEDRIARARITAPIGGTILAGELKDRLGATVKLGDPLLEIAPLEDLVVVARLDERDVSRIQPGTPGRLATKANPGLKFPLVVERIVPLAEAGEGRNVFEVRARLEGSASWMRPGMEGLVKFETGRRSLLWIGSRRLVDAVRLWLW